MASPNSTLPPTTPEEQDSRYNPGEQISREKLEGAYAQSGVEQAEAFANDPTNATREKEMAPQNSSKDGLYRPTAKKNDASRVVLKGLLKKRGPLALILGALGIGGIGIAGIFSPAIMLVQTKEALFDKFNTQLTSMEIRTNKIVSKKFSATTSGVCAGKLTVGCRYSTLSDRQVTKFKNAGIEIESKTTVFGRTRPTAIKYNGETIAASDFSAKLRTDAGFRSAMRQAYNPRFAGFSDKIWNNVATKLGINKTRALPDGDDATKAKAVDEDTKSGRKTTVPEDGVTCEGSTCKDKNGNTLTEEQANEARANRAAAAEAAEQATESTERSAANAISEGTEAIGRGALRSVGNFIKITGWADIPCQAYSAVRALGYAAKTIRAVQLARYAMVFLNTADQIKAGTATAEDVAYLGGIMTNVAYDVKSGVQRKAAMDSFGMKYTMFGDVGKSDSYLTQFMAGGGLTGDLIMITDYINSALGGGARSTCATLANGWVQAGSAAAGLALMLVPGVNVAVTAQDIAKLALSVGVAVGLSVLPNLLKDVVAGTVTKDLIGEDAGNALTSGTGAIMSPVAQAGGNGAMSVDDAIAFSQTQDKVIAMYAEEERATKSPLDATSKYTFLGSIVHQLLPYAGQVSSASGAFSAVGSIVSRSFASLVPTSSAVTAEQNRAAYTSCSDPDYKELEIATDPFCNVIYGIPERYLNRDPAEVADRLAAAGQINNDTGEIIGDDYKLILDTCINATEPLGSGGADGLGNIDNDKKCRINDSNADYYVYYVDQRIETGMDADYDGTEAPTETVEADTELPDGTAQELAARIISTGRVTDRTGQLQEIASGSRTDIDSRLVQALASLSNANTFTISSMKRGVISAGAGASSLHPLGKAADISGSAGVNGVSFGYNGHVDAVQAFLNYAAGVMPENCNIGVPNQAYVNATRPRVKSGCTVFVDRGTAPHIHLDVGRGS